MTPLGLVKHVCLDKDGVLTDVHAYWAHIVACRAKRIAETWDFDASQVTKLTRAMGVDPLTERILAGGPVGYKPRAAVIAAASRTLGRWGRVVPDRDIARLFSEVDSQLTGEAGHVRMLKGVTEALTGFKALGLKVSVYSSDYRGNLGRVVAEIGIASMLDALVGGDEVRKPKPDSDGFLLACERAGVELGETVYIGDTVDDVIMAENCGSAGGIGVLSGLMSAEDFGAVKGRGLFHNLIEVADFVSRERCCVQR